MEAKTTSHRIYYIHSKHCNVCNIALMAVKSRSKAFLPPTLRHGKSPCFSEATFLRLVDPDYPLSILPCIDVEEFVECAF
jgi:hypothetical protein